MMRRLIMLAGLLLAAGCSLPTATTPAPHPSQPAASVTEAPATTAPTQATLVPDQAAVSSTSEATPPSAPDRSLLLVTRADGPVLDFIRSAAEEYRAASGWQVQVLQKNPGALRVDAETAALAGRPPALIWTVNSDIGALVAANVLEPLGNAVDPAGVSPPALSAGALDGKQWGFPVTAGNHLVLLYNKKLLPAPPKTTADLRNMARPEGADVILASNRNDPLWLVPWLHGYGGQVIDQAGRPTLDTAAMVGALTLLKTLREKNILVAESDFGASVAHFKIGRVAMIVDGDWSVEAYAQAAQQAGFELGVAPLPVVSETQRPAAPFESGEYLLLGKGLPPEMRYAAVGFVKYLTSAAVQARVAQKLHRLPARLGPGSKEALASDPLLAAVNAAMANDEPMPARRELRAVWNAMQGPAQAVQSGEKEPQDAAREMQASAEASLRAP